jgi:hypothetical protein
LGSLTVAVGESITELVVAFGPGCSEELPRLTAHQRIATQTAMPMSISNCRSAFFIGIGRDPDRFEGFAERPAADAPGAT